MTRADPLFRYAGTADIQQLRFRLEYPRKLNAEDRAALARRWQLMSPSERDAAASAVGPFARFIERSRTEPRNVPHVLVWLAEGGHREDWSARAQPLTLGRCMWNASGMYLNQPRCALDARHVVRGGLHYCDVHARSVGLKVKERAA